MEEDEEGRMICIPYYFLGHKVGWITGDFSDEEIKQLTRQKPTRLERIIFNFLCLFSKQFRKIREKDKEKERIRKKN